MHRPVLAGRVLVSRLLEIVWQHHGRDTVFAERNPDGSVDQMAHLRGHRRLVHERARHVLVHADEVDLLLVVPSHRVARLLAGNGEHRHVIEPGVVEPGDQVRSARSRGGEADAQLAGEFGVGARHEGGHLLVANLDELDLAVRPVERLDHPVDAVSGVAEDLAHAPGVQAFDDEISNGLAHVRLLRDDSRIKSSPPKGSTCVAACLAPTQGRDLRRTIARNLLRRSRRREVGRLVRHSDRHIPLWRLLGRRRANHVRFGRLGGFRRTHDIGLRDSRLIWLSDRHCARVPIVFWSLETAAKRPLFRFAWNGGADAGSFRR